MNTFTFTSSSNLLMIYKNTLAICLLFAIKLVGSAQTTLSGKIVDKQNKPVEFATVSLLNAQDSALVRGAISNAAGDYVLQEITEGRYLLSASMLGYSKSWMGPITVVAGDSQRLPPLQLQDAVKQLKSVTVVGQKPMIEQQADRMVVNVEGSILSTGNTALEVLEKSPGVVVDQDGNISLNGKQGVTIILDGKRTYLSGADIANMLKNMPSDALEQIELITNPSAKYDAAGSAGIINIKTKKGRNRGTHGNVTVGAGYGRFEKVNSGLTFNHRQNKLNYFGSYNWGMNRSFQEFNIVREAILGQEVNLFHHQNYLLRNWQGHSYKAGVDYFIDKKNTLGLMINGSFGAWDSDNTNEALHTIEGRGNERLISTLADIDNGYRNTTMNLNYLRTINKEGRELKFDLDYSNYRGSKNDFFNNSFRYYNSRTDSIFFLRSQSPSDINIWVAKLDYTWPVAKSKVEMGAKASYVYSDNDARIEKQENKTGWTMWNKFTNDFIYQENITAAYANWSGTLEETTIMVGLRTEHTWYKGESMKHDSITSSQYISLFPSLFLKRPLNKKNSLGLSYSRRIDRPSYQDLNPFYSLLDVTTYSKGNPLLQPQFTHQVQLSHTFNNSVITNLTYSLTDGPITEVIETEGLDAFQTTRNLGTRTNWNLAVSMPVPIAKWWEMQNNVSMYHNNYTGSYQGQELDVQQLSTSINHMNTFKLPANLSAELSAFYRSPMILGNMKVNSLYSVNAGLQFSFWKRNGSLKLGVNDLFRTLVFSGKSIIGKNSIRLEGRRESRRINLTFNYSFGNKDSKPVGRKRGASSDEQDRIKGSSD